MDMTLTDQEQVDAEETQIVQQEPTEQKEEDDAPEQDESDSGSDDEQEQPTFKIRRAVRTDVVAIYKLLKRMHAESEGILPGVDDQKAMVTILNLIELRWVFIATTEDGRKLVGSIAVANDTPWYSKETSLIDMWWYVAPEYRSSGAAAALADAVIQETEEVRYQNNMKLRIANFATGKEHVRHMDVLLARIGFARVGGLYVYEE